MVVPYLPMSDEELESLTDNAIDHTEFDRLLNEVREQVRYRSTNAKCTEYMDEQGLVVLRVSYDPYDRDLLEFEFIEAGETFSVKDFAFEIAEEGAEHA